MGKSLAGLYWACTRSSRPTMPKLVRLGPTEGPGTESIIKGRKKGIRNAELDSDQTRPKPAPIAEAFPFLSRPFQAQMEAEHYQAGPSLLWPCATRRRKREDDDELEPPHMDPNDAETHHAAVSWSRVLAPSPRFPAHAVLARSYFAGRRRRRRRHGCLLR